MKKKNKNDSLQWLKMTKKILIFICILFCQNIFAQTMNESEKRFSDILETLKDEYYWQSIPEDFMGIIPQGGYEDKYPFRVALRKYQEELKTLLKSGSLSESFLIKICDLKYKKAIELGTVIDKLFELKSDAAYAKLYSIVISSEFDQQHNQFGQLINNNVGHRLMLLNKYKAEITNHLLKTDADGLNAFSYFDNYAQTPNSAIRVFDQKTEQIFVKRVINYMIRNLTSKPYLSYSCVSSFERYYNRTFEEDVHKYFKNADNGEPLEKARRRFYTNSSKNVINYYKKLKK